MSFVEKLYRRCSVKYTPNYKLNWKLIFKLGFNGNSFISLQRYDYGWYKF